MTEAARLLMLEFLRWVADRPRTYADVMEAWRSNCPRHPVWEDALIDGLVRYQGDGRKVSLTNAGAALLRREADRTPAPAVRRSASAPHGRRPLT
jgi:hypothetical protein